MSGEVRAEVRDWVKKNLKRKQAEGCDGSAVGGLSTLCVKGRKYFNSGTEAKMEVGFLVVLKVLTSGPGVAAFKFTLGHECVFLCERMHLRT